MNPDFPASQRHAAWKWWVCGLLLLATMFNYMDRLALNLTSSMVRRAFWLDERDYGQLESVFAFAFALGSICFGWLADRINVRWLFPAAVLAWSAAGFATGLVESFAMLLVCRFCLGLFEGSNWPCSLRTTQRILPPAQRSLGNGILQSGTAAGSVVAPLIVGLLVLDNSNILPSLVASGGAASGVGLPVDPSWRLVFLVVGGIGITWVFLWLPSVRSADLALPPPQPGPTLMSVLGWLVFLLAVDFGLHLPPVREALPWLPLTAKVVITVLGIGGVFLWLTHATGDDTTLPRRTFFRRFWVLLTLVVSINLTWHFLRAWLPLFLQDKHGYTVKEASQFFICYYLAADVGSLTAGFLTVLLVRRGLTVFGSRIVIFAACAMLTLLSLLVTHLEEPWQLQVVLMVVGCGSLGLFPMYYSFSQELTTQHQGKVTGCLGCSVWLAMSLLHELVGERVKDTKSYAEGLGLAGLTPLVGLAALMVFWKPSEKT
jgi:ACS family hexuronate transporter-like MFS transporter